MFSNVPANVRDLDLHVGGGDVLGRGRGGLGEVAVVGDAQLRAALLQWPRTLAAAASHTCTHCRFASKENTEQRWTRRKAAGRESESEGASC